MSENKKNDIDFGAFNIINLKFSISKKQEKVTPKVDDGRVMEIDFHDVRQYRSILSLSLLLCPSLSLSRSLIRGDVAWRMERDH